MPQFAHLNGNFPQVWKTYHCLSLRYHSLSFCIIKCFEHCFLLNTKGKAFTKDGFSTLENNVIELSIHLLNLLFFIDLQILPQTLHFFLDFSLRLLLNTQSLGLQTGNKLI